MRELAQQLLAKTGRPEAETAPARPLGRGALLVCVGRTLLVVSECRKQQPDGFEGEEIRLDDGGIALACAFSARNAAALRRHFPWCVPSVPGGTRPTVCIGPWDGVADRLEKVRGRGWFPVFPAAPESGLCAADEAAFLIFSAGFRDGFAVDGGRVSTATALERALAGGAGTVTLTPGENGPATAAEEYAGKRFVLNSRDAVFIGRDEAAACAARLGGMVNILAAKRAGFDPGIGLDDGEEPTTYAAHLYAVRELRKRSCECSVVFLRYPAEPEAFRERFRLHAEIARMYGGYKLGLRLAGISPALFRELRRECDGMLHLEPDAAAWEQIEAYFPV